MYGWIPNLKVSEITALFERELALKKAAFLDINKLE